MIDRFRAPYFFLSNFYEHKFTFDGRQYMNAEAAFQSMKAPENKRDIYSKVKPITAKALGRRERLPDDWDAKSQDVMLAVVRAKFSDPVLAEKLRETYPHELVEGNIWHDNKWGNCTCGRCANRKGHNLLGQILMQVRSELMNKT